MKADLQLKLQAYLDGELAPDEARKVTAWLAQDADARALLVELQNTGRALADFESGIKLPETREFYWSKIQREIQRLEQRPPGRSPTAWSKVWQRVLIPAGALAVALLAAVIILPQLGPGSQPAEAEYALTDDSGSFTYRDYTSGTTLVWLPYEAENEFAEMGAEDTIQ